MFTNSRGGITTDCLWNMNYWINSLKQNTRLVTVRQNNFRDIIHFSIFHSFMIMTPTVTKDLKWHMQFVLFPFVSSPTALTSDNTYCVIQPWLKFSFWLPDFQSIHTCIHLTITVWQVEWNHELNSSESLHIDSGIAQFWLKTDTNWTAVEELMMRQGWTPAQGLTVLQARAISNNTGIWSENTVSQISRLRKGKPKDKSRSSVCPNTDCTRLKESMRYKKSFVIGFSGQHTWKLKPPTIRTINDRI